jgi:hypothetical protein
MDLKPYPIPRSADGSSGVVTGHFAGAYSSQIWVVPVEAALDNLSQRHFLTRTRAMVRRWRVACVPVQRRDDGSTLGEPPGASPRKLTDLPEGVIDFRWSPDGRHVGYLSADPNPEQAAKQRTGDDAIVSGEGYTPTRLHIVLVEGAGERVFPSSGRHLLSFDWAPDGSKVVYAAQKSPAGRDAFHVDIYETDLTSGRETPLVVPAGPGSRPVHSRDGRLVAFYSQRGRSAILANGKSASCPRAAEIFAMSPSVWMAMFSVAQRSFGGPIPVTRPS